MYTCISPMRCACLSRLPQITSQDSPPTQMLNAPTSHRNRTISSCPRHHSTSPTPCLHGFDAIKPPRAGSFFHTRSHVLLHRTLFPEIHRTAGAAARVSQTAMGIRASSHNSHILSNLASENSTPDTTPATPTLHDTIFTFLACLCLLAYVQYTPAAQAQLVGSSGLQISRVDSNAPRVPRSATSYDPVSAEEREASSAFSARVDAAVQLLEGGKRAQSEGDFEKALKLYTQVVEEDGDLALSSYARVGRALSLYQVGDRSQSILELEDMSVDLKGYPEIHAALAAAFYADKHALIQAEQQFTLASLMDKRYTDLDWVVSNKHWPPSLVVSLRKFLELS